MKNGKVMIFQTYGFFDLKRKAKLHAFEMCKLFFGTNNNRETMEMIRKYHSLLLFYKDGSIYDGYVQEKKAEIVLC